jgi:hypothetical protein
VLDTEPLTLNHPRVQAAKAKWDAATKIAGSRRKHSLTFEDLFEYFKADCVRHARIAELAGVTREAIRQIYNKYFRELFDKSGKERVHACTLETRFVQIKRSENELFQQNPLFKVIVDKARAAGCVVEALPVCFRSGLAGKVSSENLLINGHLCSLHCLTGRAGNKRLIRCYTHTNISYSTMMEAKALILHTAVNGFQERTFVVPTANLRRVHRSAMKGASTHIVLPTERLPVYNNQHPKVDYWQYEDAWHLLPPKATPPVSE